ncbi:hypothetical protein AB0K08_16850 [Citricoccus sp. NPDC055426]|uniref:hypothetical protein n=1 Tax=Citricoccus sp. NPDC055426 TaxID=3155536 RepID=UPI0034121EC1
MLNFDTSRNSAGRIWEYAVRMASEEAGTTVLDPGEQAMLDALLDTLPADDPCRQNLAALAIFARIAERLYFSAEVTACASTWLDSHRPPLAELPALTEPDTTGPRPAGHDTAEDRPPPPDLLALTTTVLTSAPPAPAPPVSGAAAAVPVAA